VPSLRSNGSIAASLALAVFFWGGNNVGVKHLVTSWPPVFVGATRFLCAGLLLLALLRWTRWFGRMGALTPGLRAPLWRSSILLALYILAFNWALFFTSASHVALYLGAAPVWALLWEGWPERQWRSLQRYGAAALALTGVAVLFWPALTFDSAEWPGELLGLSASVLWTAYSRQCRTLATELNGVEITGRTMCRGGLLLLPFVLLEIALQPISWRADLLGIQLYCILAGGVVAFGLWNSALRYWPVSKVFLFNNLIPLSTCAWAAVFLHEAITPAFGWAMALVVAGVVLGQSAPRGLGVSQQGALASVPPQGTVALPNPSEPRVPDHGTV
jgi:drug/metabolite transporter (DMT)-like permease